MASFNRSDYQQVFRFAARVYAHFDTAGGGGSLSDDAVQIMNLCEMVIGQQSDRPGRQEGKE